MDSRLIIALVFMPIALAWPMEKEGKGMEDDMYRQWKSMHDKKQEEFMEWKKQKMDEKKEAFMEWKDKHDDMVDKFQEWKEDKQDEMKRKFMEWKEKQEEMKKKFQEYQEKQKEEQKRQFMEWKHKMEEQKRDQDKDMDDEKMAMIKKWRMWDEKMQHLENFDKMMDQFNEKRHHFVFKVMHQMLEFCNSDETAKAMRGVLGNELMNQTQQGENGQMGLHGNMMPEDINWSVDMNNEADMKALAERVKKMSDKQQMKLYIGGMIKSMCTGAKTFALQTYQWKEKYLN